MKSPVPGFQVYLPLVFSAYPFERLTHDPANDLQLPTFKFLPVISVGSLPR